MCAYDSYNGHTIIIIQDDEIASFIACLELKISELELEVSSKDFSNRDMDSNLFYLSFTADYRELAIATQDCIKETYGLEVTKRIEKEMLRGIGIIQGSISPKSPH